MSSINESRQLRGAGDLVVDIEGSEQKVQFIKWCIGSALGVVLGIFLLSFIQEIMRRRRVRRLQKKRNAITIGTSGGKKGPGMNPDKLQNDIQQSLRVKKFSSEEDLDQTSPLSDASFNDVDSSEQDGSMAASDKINPFRKSDSILTTNPTTSKTSQVCKGPCELCEKAFAVGDDVCESNSPRCNHLFHKDCIAAWLPYQNTCPVCSETFVILNETTA